MLTTLTTLPKPQAQRIPRIECGLDPLTIQLAHHLAAAKPGDVVSYADMKTLIGLDLQRHNGRLQNARRLARLLAGAIFKTLPNVGFLCLGEAEKVPYIETKLGHVHNATVDVVKDTLAVNTDALTPTEKIRHLGVQTIAGYMSLLTHEHLLYQGHPQAPALPVWDIQKSQHLFEGL